MKLSVIMLIASILGWNYTAKTETSQEKTLKVHLENKSNSSVSGLAVFTQKKADVFLSLKLQGLQPNTTHAVHIHEKADCSAADGTSSGGHWNPTAQNHGKWGDAKGFHRGDIGNVVSDAKGNATLKMKTDLWCLDCKDETKNIVGKAIIVHSGADDFTTQPTGAAGGRVSCGAIIK